MKRPMINFLCLILIFACLSVSTMAADLVAEPDSTATGWKQSLITDLTTTQTAYSDSWAGGEAGSFSWVGNLNGSAEKQLSSKFNFRISLKLSFGQTISQSEETKKWTKPVKSTDLIDWENVARFTLGGYVDPFAAVRLETQFMDASVVAQKRYLSPMKLTESFGIARLFFEKDKDRLFSRLGLAVRQLITKDFVDLVELTTETNTSTDIGLELVTDLSLSLHEQLSYTGKLTLFKALSFSKADDVKGTPEEDYWRAVDINWENIIHANITKIIAVNLYTQLLYDKEVSKRGRFKETLGIGFVFKLI